MDDGRREGWQRAWHAEKRSTKRCHRCFPHLPPRPLSITSSWHSVPHNSLPLPPHSVCIHHPRHEPAPHASISRSDLRPPAPPCFDIPLAAGGVQALCQRHTACSPTPSPACPPPSKGRQRIQNVSAPPHSHCSHACTPGDDYKSDQINLQRADGEHPPSIDTSGRHPPLSPARLCSDTPPNQHEADPHFPLPARVSASTRWLRGHLLLLNK